jgi:hypothetical protein
MVLQATSEIKIAGVYQCDNSRSDDMAMFSRRTLGLRCVHIVFQNEISYLNLIRSGCKIGTLLSWCNLKNFREFCVVSLGHFHTCGWGSALVPLVEALFPSQVTVFVLQLPVRCSLNARAFASRATYRRRWQKSWWLNSLCCIYLCTIVNCHLISSNCRPRICKMT